MAKLAYHIVRILLTLVALLPLSILYVLSDVICFFVYHVGRYQLATVRRNLERSFPEKQPDELKSIERRFYRQLCDNIVESIKLLHVSDRTMLRHVDVRGAELIEQAADDHRPVFLFIGHMGNWEWVQEVTRRISRPTVQGEIYHPLRGEVGERLMRQVRSRYHTILIPQAEAVRKILSMKRDFDSYLIGFIADQRPRRRSLTHWMEFLHQDTPYMVGAEEIGRHVDAKLLFLHVAKPGRGHYVMTVKDMVLSPEEKTDEKGKFPYTELYMRMLEDNIREYPHLWLWSHKRWKHQRS